MIEKPLTPSDLVTDGAELEIAETPSNIIELPDGGAEIILSDDPEETIVAHDANLADHMDDGALAALGSELIDLIEADIESRADWEKMVVDGLDYIGLTIEERTEPFEGACGIHHPILAEAIIKFQSQAIMETFPPEGPVRTRIIGVETPEKVAQAQRVRDYMNYQLTEKMPEYRPDTEQMYFRLGFMGSAFRKVYQDQSLGRQVCRFIPAEDFIVSYDTTDLYTSGRYTQRFSISENDIRKNIVAGIWRDIELTPSDDTEPNKLRDKIDKIIGRSRPDLKGRNGFSFYEIHVDLDLEGFEDPDGIANPYIVTLDAGTGEIFRIERNWIEGDPLKRKRDYFVHYPLIPGFGFYCLGFVHLIGGIAKGATSTLRQLIDAGTFSNLPAGFKARGLRIKGDDTPLSPGEWRDVDAPSGSIRESFMPLPYKEPSVVLAELFQQIVQMGERFASTADLPIPDSARDIPVGTTVALLERSLKVMSAIHARLHEAQKQEFRLLARVIQEYLPEEYPYDVAGGSRRIMRADFDDRVDILPASDPNVASVAQKVMLVQEQMKLSQMAPNLYNQYELHVQANLAMGARNIEKILVPPQDAKALDPLSENMNALMGKPLKAAMEQNHDAHIQAHMALAQNPSLAQNPMAMQSIQAHVQEHMALKIYVEVNQMLGGQLPPPGTPLPPQVEAQMSVMVAQAMAVITQRDQMLAQAAQNAGNPILQAEQIKSQTKLQGEAMKAEIEKQKIAQDDRQLAAEVMVREEEIASRERIASEKSRQQQQRYIP